jgi:hypothetical protein
MAQLPDDLMNRLPLAASLPFFLGAAVQNKGRHSQLSQAHPLYD